MGDDYDIIKGKALTMCREFRKVYPAEPIGDRIANEVWFAANNTITPTAKIDTIRLHKIIREIKECV